MTVLIHSSGKMKCLVCSTKHKLGKPGVYFVVFTTELVLSNLSKFTVKLIKSFLQYLQLVVCFLGYSLWSWWCVFCGTHCEVGGVQPVEVGGVLQLVILLPRGDGHRRDPDQSNHQQLWQVKLKEPPVRLQIITHSLTKVILIVY